MDTSKLSFEEAYKQLTELVQKMESGEMPLADSVAAYEKGIKLNASDSTAKECSMTQNPTYAHNDGASCAVWIIRHNNLDYKYRDVSAEW